MPRDTDRPDPSLTTPLGPPIRQAAPAPAPAPSKQPQPGAMDVSDIGMIMRDCTPKPAKPATMQGVDARKAKWAERIAEAKAMDQLCAELDAAQGRTSKLAKLNEWQRGEWLRMSAEQAPELHPRRHLDWPAIDPDMIEQAPRRRAAWLPERD